MTNLYLIVPISDDSDSGDVSYVRQILTRDRIGVMLSLLENLRSLRSRNDPVDVVKIIATDYGAQFVWDEEFEQHNESPVGRFYERLKVDGDCLFLGASNDAAAIRKGQIQMVVSPYGVSWQLTVPSSAKRYVSREIPESMLCVARCFVCPDAELYDAVRALRIRAPDYLSLWIQYGQIISDDGIYKRVLPPLIPEDVAPLLQDVDPRVRERTIIGLSALSARVKSSLKRTTP